MLIQVNLVELPFVMENQIVLFLVAQELSVKKIQMARPLAGCFFQIYELIFYPLFWLLMSDTQARLLKLRYVMTLLQ